ncbi:MAG: hypothetical protein FWG09_00375 [Synergistaceae bacterium]|nr:hypothetical protein [Synergistaceae bacterium]
MAKGSDRRSVNSVLLVSPSVIYRKMVKNAFSELLPNAVLISENAEGSALSRLKEFKPDLIITDVAAIIDKGGISGITSAHPDIPEVLLCDQGAYEHYHAGAAMRGRVEREKLHFIVKPVNEDYESNFKTLKRELKLALLNLLKEWKEEPPLPDKSGGEKFSILLFAASTGGPAAIEVIFSGLPKKLPLPVLIVQHMPALFTKNLAGNLSRQFSVDISEASGGESLKDGKILIAPGGCHMVIDKDKKTTLNDGEAVNGVKPSADVLFTSVAEQFKGEKILAVVLTGMGSDGTEGVKELKRSCECFCIAQNEESCVVYGMPRAIVEAGLHDRIAGIGTISGLISKLLGIDASGEEDI